MLNIMFLLRKNEERHIAVTESWIYLLNLLEEVIKIVGKPLP